MPSQILNDGGTMGTGTDSWHLTADGYFTNGLLTTTVKKKDGLNPRLYFKYVKKKFKPLEKMRIDRRLARLEKAFDKAAKAGHDGLSKKILNKVVKEAKESLIFAKGFKYFIDREVLHKHKNNIRGGHISDTKFEDYTRHIPKDVLTKKKKSDGLFDGYVIYHYWSNEVSDKLDEVKQEMDDEEREKMKDPILFGVIKETKRLYFIADWEDELCDLTFDELIDALDLEDEDVRLTHKPEDIC